MFLAVVVDNQKKQFAVFENSFFFFGFLFILIFS